VSGVVEVVAATWLRRGAASSLVVLLVSAAWSLVADIAVTGKHELHRSLVTAVLALLAAVTLIGAVPEWRNADRSRRGRAADATPPPQP
jgi:hypothetical protein